MSKRSTTYSEKYKPKNGHTATHGMSGHYLYYCWQQIKYRCENPKAAQFKDYGGRGITVCKQWANNPKAFFEWAIINGYKKGLTVERINNEKGYHPDNCKLANRFHQQRNRRNSIKIEYHGEMKTVREWAAILDIKYSKLLSRLFRYKMPVDIAFDMSITPERKNKRKEFDKSAAIAVGEKIKQFLDGRKQGWLADKLGITEVALSKKIHGRIEFSQKELSEIAKIFPEAGDQLQNG